MSALVAIGVIWLVTWINLMGIKQAGIFQVITTIMKLVPLVALAALGLFWVHWGHFVPFNTSGQSPFGAITAVAALTLWAFLGVESATIPADDVENPSKTIPRATVLGTIVTALVYILSTVAVMGIIPLARLGTSSAPYADALDNEHEAVPSANLGNVPSQISKDVVYILVKAGHIIRKW